MISVIVPTLDEGARLPALLAALAAQAEPHEVIVVDGGSRDGTADLAAVFGTTVLATRPGRGLQLATGAASARGTVLLFLHADSRFPAGGLAAVAQALGDPAVIGGNFRLLFDGGDRFSAWLDRFYAWLRARGIYYGDSGIFVRRAAFDRIGGIRPIALMEDFDFVRRLEAAGRTVCIAEPALITSARRFQGRRPTAIVAGWLMIHGLYCLGVDPATLARLYRSDRRPRRRMAHTLAAAIVVAGVAALPALAQDQRLAAAGWQVLRFGSTPPTQFRAQDGGVIEIAAAGGAGFLYRQIAAGEAESRLLAWRWQVVAAPPPSDPAVEGRDDRPLTVHVFFAADGARAGFLDGIGRALRARLYGAPFAGRLITYMWGGTAPAGTRLANPYLPRDGRIVVLRDGTAQLGAWQRELVDLAADYQAAFGTPAPLPAYIAVSADADDLGGRSLGRIADLAFVRRAAPAGARR